MKTYLFLLLMISSAVFVSAQTDSLRYKYNPNYQRQIEMYEAYNTKQADIVMLGNSITHGVNWGELLGRNDIVGRGIPSDIVEGFRNRLKYVLNIKPKVCFIMGGINDIYGWIPVDEVFQSYVKLIKELQAKNVIVVIQSTLYVSSKWPNAENRNPEVEKLNALLSAYASQNNIVFMDLNSRLSFRKYLIEDMTYDGVHLTAKAYKIWGREIEKTLKKLGM